MQGNWDKVAPLEHLAIDLSWEDSSLCFYCCLKPCFQLMSTVYVEEGRKGVWEFLSV